MNPRIATQSNSNAKISRKIFGAKKIHDLTQIPEIYDMNKFNHGKSFRFRIKEFKVP